MAVGIAALLVPAFVPGLTAAMHVTQSDILGLEPPPAAKKPKGTALTGYNLQDVATPSPVAYNCLMPSGLHAKIVEGNIFMLTKLSAPEPFSFVRYGVGEWMCALGQTFRNVDMQDAHPDMCHQLASFTWNETKRPGTFMLFSHHVCRFTSALERKHVELGAWYAFFGFLQYLLPERGQGLKELMDGVRGRGPVVLVGPKFLGRLHAAFGHVGHVPVPNQRYCGGHEDAWPAHEEIERGIREQSARFPGGGVQFLVAGGMAAKVIIMNMVAELGQKDSFMDIGSTFDAFAGYASRDYNVDLLAHLRGGPLVDWFNATDLEGMAAEGRPPPAAQSYKLNRS
eukprot:CAMPEP_0168485516 /NCGR_PEP_ID=MMETSP0228-20121227/66649_1 /TAXON_ID=133427 /ORGANISM="Protoceratium reticulatum, Strain CCCM 535 (=CCMP 1889)" /LENGTH=339 /DNA_ID=CAMNT_0008502081 /DNA_START=18 /DNA_END=1034 /DNA_ORIENTATION=+